jgi:Fe-S-cluster-containing hydrogenase component 2
MMERIVVSMTEDLCSRFGLCQEVCTFGVIDMLPKDENLMAHANSIIMPFSLRRANIDFQVPQGTSFSPKLIGAFEIKPEFLSMDILSPQRQQTEGTSQHFKEVRVNT